MSIMTVPASFNYITMAESCLLSRPSLLYNKTKYPFLSIASKSFKLQVAHSNSPIFSPTLSLTRRTHLSSSVLTFVAQLSDWAQQQEEEEEEEENTVSVEEGEQDEPTWENQDADENEARLSDLEPNGEEAGIEGTEGEEEGGADGTFVEPPKDARIFVGNLPFDFDSEKLATLFQQAGTVEVAKVIYDRETDHSRGFGFVTMSTVEEAEKAVGKFSHYELDGRLLTVSKANQRGTRSGRSPRGFEHRVFVGNLPWEVDKARLEQVFSEHGKVVNAWVVYDRETGQSRGFGFVTMSSEIEVNDAIVALDGQTVDGRALRARVAEQRTRRSSF